MNKSILNPDELFEFINQKLTPNVKNKKERGEVFTPIELVKEMLDKLPKEVWANPDLKWLDPAVGIGNFPIIAYLNLMDGLKEWQPNEEKRRKHILENMLYMVEINNNNIIILNDLLCGNKYKLNIHTGDFLEADLNKIFGIEKFDIIMGNPPYQKQVGPNKTQPIWNLFTNLSIDKLNLDGYLIFIHPSGWRNITGNFRDVYDKVMSTKLIYINMNNFKKGNKIFGVGTNFDYYLLQNNDIKQSVKIVDIYDKEYNIDLSKWSFIPSGGFELFEKIIARDDEDKIDVIYSRSLYGTDKKNMNEKKTDKFKHPCIYTITLRNGIKCFYSEEKKGHFGIPKVIWTNGLGTYPILDDNGKYGLTQFSYAIIDDKENLDNIKQTLETEEFIKLMEYVKFTNNKYNYKIISLMKKDFWKTYAFNS
jgi:hypothetical protein